MPIDGDLMASQCLNGIICSPGLIRLMKQDIKRCSEEAAGKIEKFQGQCWRLEIRYVTIDSYVTQESIGAAGIFKPLKIVSTTSKEHQLVTFLNLFLVVMDPTSMSSSKKL